MWYEYVVSQPFEELPPPPNPQINFLSKVCVKLIWSALQRNFYSGIPRKKELRGLSPNFHIHLSVCDLYIPRIGLPILRGLSPNFHIHGSVSDLYIPTVSPSIFLQENRRTDRGNISHTET
jgi:hypothetical protein